MSAIAPIGGVAFDPGALFAKPYRFLHRLLFNTAVDAYPAALDLAFTHSEFFFHHRNPTLSFVVYLLSGALTLLASLSRGMRRGLSLRTIPALLPPPCRPFINVNQISTLHNAQATVSARVRRLHYDQ